MCKFKRGVKRLPMQVASIHSSDIDTHSNDLSISPTNLATRVRLMKSVQPALFQPLNPCRDK
jgi:hypothetical protein